MRIVDSAGYYWDLKVTYDDERRPLIIITDADGKVVRLQPDADDLNDLSSDMVDACNGDDIGTSR